MNDNNNNNDDIKLIDNHNHQSVDDHFDSLSKSSEKQNSTDSGFHDEAINEYKSKILTNNLSTIATESSYYENKPILDDSNNNNNSNSNYTLFYRAIQSDRKMSIHQIDNRDIHKCSTLNLKFLARSTVD
ncbi:unnamed protein product [Heterobilharzia americana]|nr:unnamed protein product [Heterobilharzia americana]